MKCHHCGSTDIIAIQGQHFCLNCGQAVVENTVSDASEATPPSVTETKTETSPDAKKPDGDIKKSASANPGQARVTVSSKSLDRQAVHPTRFSAFVAVALGIVTGVVTALGLALQLNTDLLLYAAVGCLTGVIVMTLLAESALIYGVSRNQDGRPTRHESWWIAAQGGLLDTINVSIASLIVVAILVAVGFLTWYSINHAHLGTGVALAVSLVINLGLAWLLLGTFVVRRLAVTGVVVGGVSAVRALMIGWRIFFKAGGHLAVASLEALIGWLLAIVVLAVALLGAAALIKPDASVEIIVGTALAAAASVAALAFVAMEWESRIWLKQYRQWVGLLPAKERLQLLTGRAQPVS